MSDVNTLSNISGPLTEYRKQSSFDCNKLRLFMDNDEALRLKTKVWNIIESEPLFHQPAITPSPDEQHRITLKRIKYLQAKKIVSGNDFFNNMKINAMVSALGQYDASLALIYPREQAAFLKAIHEFGTQRHKEYLQDCLSNKIFGCLAAEEISGSCRTTAIYDHKTQEFELHTPDFEAAKCWTPALGVSSTHAVVYASIITGNGVDHGVHLFVVPIRDPLTLISYPGVIVGKIGEKTGQNGTGSGFLMFNNYHIPRENLLNALADVSPTGIYMRTTKNITYEDVHRQMKLHNTITTTSLSAALLAKAVTIAVRYSAARKQFGPTTTNELPVIEYQLQQWRLFPYLATSYALKIFANFLVQTLDDKYPKDFTVLKEMQHLSSVGKYVATSVTCDGSQECREACGGHGYLKVSGIGDIRNDNDGEHVSTASNNAALLGCTSWLLELWSKQHHAGTSAFKFPFGSVEFIGNHPYILSKKFSAATINDAVNPEELLSAYQWLVCWLLKTTEEKLTKKGFQLSDCEVFSATPLAKAYIEHFILQKFVNYAKSARNHSVKAVLLKLSSVYGVWSLEKHLPLLYQGGYMSGREPALLIQEGLLQLCALLKSEAISLVDVLAPPDKVLSSVLGQSDGNVYRNLQSSFFNNEQTFERPAWWKDIVYWQQSKL